MEELKPPADDDDQLIQNLKNKDDGDFSPAFVQLDRKYKARILRFLQLRYRLPAGIAEEIYYGSLYKACDRISELTHPGAFKTWFYRIVHNDARQWFRDNQEMLNTEEFLETEGWGEIGDLPAVVEEDDERARAPVEIQAVRSAWNHLKDSEREILWYTIVFPESGTAILAEQFGISPSGVRQRKKRALDRLKALYSEEIQLRQLSLRRRRSGPLESR